MAAVVLVEATKSKKRDSASAIICLVLLSLFSVMVVVRISSSTITRYDLQPISFFSRITPDEAIGERRQQKTVMLRDPYNQATPQPGNRITTTAPPTPAARARITCDRSRYHYDICSISGPTVLDPTTSTFSLIGPAHSEPIAEQIRPYPRKWESFIMSGIKQITLTSAGPPTAHCDVKHNTPALVFSAGGYTGNFFHDFNDGFIPLFITVHSVFPSPSDGDFVFVIEKSRHWWLSKYADLLRTFTKHPIINLDNDTSTHCFTSATLGLISHGFMTIDPKRFLDGPISLHHFRSFLERAYSPNSRYHDQSQAQLISRHRGAVTRRPTLVLASRSGGVGRVMLNQDEAKAVAEEVGFKVVVFEPTASDPLKESYELINRSHAMVGVHGAALTHMVFMRPGSVLVQVVPVGAEWLAEACFGKPAREMGLEYMEYKARAGESSLVDRYGKDDPVMRDPKGLQMGWKSELMEIYLKEQNVRLDLVRFRGYMKKAYSKAKRFMVRNSLLVR
ncbi:hypothetical protein Dimus_014871 [Dionaea muscipula]